MVDTCCTIGRASVQQMSSRSSMEQFYRLYLRKLMELDALAVTEGTCCPGKQTGFDCVGG